MPFVFAAFVISSAARAAAKWNVRSSSCVSSEAIR